MSEKDRELDLLKVSRRGDQAQAILDNPLFKEAFQLQRDTLIEQMTEAKTVTDEDKEWLAELNRRLKAVNYAERNLEAAIRGGNKAKSKLQELVDKAKNTLKMAG